MFSTTNSLSTLVTAMSSMHVLSNTDEFYKDKTHVFGYHYGTIMSKIDGSYVRNQVFT